MTSGYQVAVPAAHGRRPGELLQRLIAEGHRALRASAEASRAAVYATEGALTGVYEPDYVQRLREDWPA